MRVAWLLTIGTLLCCGCRVNPNAEREIALLRAEILDLEDQYYALKSQRDTAVSQLRDCQGTEFDASRFSDSEFPIDCENCNDGEIIYDSAPMTYEDPEFAPAPGDPGSLPMELNSDGVDSEETGSPIIEDQPFMDEVPAVDEGFSAGISNRTPVRDRRRGNDHSEVQAVRIHPRVSQGQDLDGIPGHEGISLMVQPVSQSGEVVGETGQMTIRILESGWLASSRQIGSWSFAPDEINTFRVRDDSPDQGILFHLPWSQILPTRNQIHVIVDFAISENRRYSATARMPIVPPTASYTLDEPFIVHWMEHDPRWRDSGSIPDVAGVHRNEDLDRTDLQGTFDAVNSQAENVKSDRHTSIPRWRPVR